ncbi:hypothetical protein TGAM01_v208004 [Trichoderma gamsii]|uniref:Uncharacterized protein n=1 Tax=Trichoderma gamsii TaxID=398673 RepID=A0A2P4ZG19_9HYPO|nr:hypothetical protein TGAM01_v208004 [Trichoderma gamsii]PON23231.1 hypothetical protein TGAM01_v208004 [Trichoderma gamsii]
MAHQRYATTVPDVERNDGQSRSGSSTASWWLLLHQGKSFSDGTAAGNGFKAHPSQASISSSCEPVTPSHEKGSTPSLAASLCSASTSFAGQQSHPMSVSLSDGPGPPSPASALANDTAARRPHTDSGFKSFASLG